MRSAFAIRPGTLGVAAAKLIAVLVGAAVVQSLVLVALIVVLNTDHADEEPGITVPHAERLIGEYLSSYGVTLRRDGETWYDHYALQCVQETGIWFTCNGSSREHVPGVTDANRRWFSAAYVCDPSRCIPRP